MLKSGLIVGLVALLLATGTTMALPICTPCLALLLGAVAGYLAARFDKPVSSAAAAKLGALAGLIGGSGALLGQVIGTAIKGTMLGPEEAARLAQSLGLPAGGPGFANGFWGGLVASAACLGLLDLAFMAALGALGGVIWWQRTNKNVQPVAPLE